MAPQQQPKKDVQVVVKPRQSDESFSSEEDQKPLKISTSRQPRFAEITSSTADSPIEPTTTHTARQVSMTHYQPQPQVPDVGFGYIANNRDSQVSGVEMPATPRSPLKSAMKAPGAPARNVGDNPLSPTFTMNPLSPTWKEEKKLEKTEKRTTKQQRKDLRVKTRVRMAKILLRGTNFACSLIVLSMITSTFSIFNSSKSLAPRNGLPPWAVGTAIWPQVTVLVISCISLFLCVIIMIGMCRAKGRKSGRTRKAAKYYTIFTIGFFTYSIVMWGVGAGILQGSKANGNSQDLWGWSCKDNARRHFFSEVNYEVVCNLQNWSLVCALIEILVETLTILIYGIVFYRFYSKRKLMKSMNTRDDARKDLYLAQLRIQSAPNTPGFPLSPREGGYNPMFSPRYAPGQAFTTDEKHAPDDYSAAEEGECDNVRYISAPTPQQQHAAQSAKPFMLQAPPTRTTPKTQQSPTFATRSENPFLGAADGSRPQTPRSMVPIPPPPMSPTSSLPPMSPMSPGFAKPVVHTPAAPGEQQYGAVPIPGAYASPVQSPTFAPPQQHTFQPPQWR